MYEWSQYSQVNFLYIAMEINCSQIVQSATRLLSSKYRVNYLQIVAYKFCETQLLLRALLRQYNWVWLKTLPK